MKRIAVVIYGFPGSGKSTQAELVANANGLVRFDTGMHIAEILNDPKNAGDEIVERQRKLYTSGGLCERPWVFEIVKEGIMRIIHAGYGVVLSGSPRTSYEAFDEGSRKGIYSLLMEGYGEAQVHTFSLKTKVESSWERNSRRKICVTCKRAYLGSAECMASNCPFCGAPLATRKDDRKEVIEERLRAFREETEPIVARLPQLGLTVHTINGEQPPFMVFKELQEWLL